jgi:plasmid maintenance system killer protein
VLITYRTKRLAKICNDSQRASVKLGAEQAKRLRQRLDDLHAVGTLSVMRNLPGRTHELDGDRKGELSIDLVHPYRLIFVPANSPIPLKEDGGFDWTAITEIEIIEITDTHD